MKSTMNWVALLLALFATQSFAISPGAGQAQIRNNLQTIQQNKQQIRQMQQFQNRQNQLRIQQNQIQKGAPRIPQ